MLKRKTERWLNTKLYTNYKMNDENVKDYQQHEQIIKTIKNRFMTYGYKRIKTSAFEHYDLYSQVKSSIHQSDMVKIIDRTGDVLVLRPDATIPITRKIAQDMTRISGERRYFYVQDVFRHPVNHDDHIENTQAGIEYFGETSPEADAEVIALACHTLQDLGFNDVKIEIGHAGFFQELIDVITINPRELKELKDLIQAKNGVDIKPFLAGLSVDEQVATAIETIPFLYGNPVEVSDRAKKIALTDKMTEKLDHLVQVYELLKLHDLEKYMVMDLGLINQMDYYSDVIFQGFVEGIGKPVLMGGRYDKLAKEFGTSIPAIGFACQVDALVKAIGHHTEPSTHPIDVEVIYESSLIREAFALTNQLREQGLSVVTYASGKQINEQVTMYKVKLTKDQYTVNHDEQLQTFTDIKDLLVLMGGGD